MSVATTGNNEARAAAAASPAATVRALFPWRDVVLPWLVSRALTATVVAGAASWPFSDGLRFRGFFAWDGGWYSHIARFGYGPPPTEGVASPWPFFPLLPALIRGLDEVGIPGRAGVVVLNHFVFLVALAGLHRLARRHASTRAAGLAVWALALFPGAFVFSMLYPSAIFLAASVWAFLLAEDRQDLGAAALLAVAAMTRPNGLVLAVALALALRSWRRVAVVSGPAIAAVGVWCALCWHWTGDPVVFFTAKSAWGEVTLFTLLFPISDYGALVHFALGTAALVVVAVEWRALPRPWSAFTVLYLLPPLVLGIIGLGRYTNECFPPFVAAGRALERWSSSLRRAAITVSAGALVVCGTAIVRYHFVP
jgi:hypothetical protein